MKNPLNKRIGRELKSELGKYVVIFLFFTLAVGLISGFLVAGNSMKAAYDESFERYNIEDGHFRLGKEIDSDMINRLEEEEGITVYENFYVEISVFENHTWRIYKNRSEVDKICLMDGSMPENDREIAVDRLYAENNDISIGDIVEINDEDWTVCGFIAMSDYSALFKENTDSMFDANKFNVAVVTDEDFDFLAEDKLFYNYAWKYNDDTLGTNEKYEKGNELLETIYTYSLIQENSIEDFVKQEDNQAINFTGDDMGADKSFLTTLMYIVTVIFAFVLAVSTSDTIDKEAMAVGTLRASGYKKSELITHYMVLPVTVTVVAAILGNIAGYTFMKYVCAAMYYGSYSLTSYVTLWNTDAFIKTTVIPLVIMFVVNYLVLWKKLSLSPLRLIRRDLTKRKKKRAVRLPDIKFLSRFRMRIIFSNVSAYIVLFAGILFANLLLLCGLMLMPVLENHKESVIDNMFCRYQYILNTQTDTEEETAEKYAVNALDYESGKRTEEISVYGINSDSDYIKNLSFDERENVYVTDGYMKKYNLEVGDTIRLSEKYGDKVYEFKITGSYYYPAALAVFMDIDYFNEVFGNDEDYYNGYLSNVELTDIDEGYVVNVVTESVLVVISDQLIDSMGGLIYLFAVFAVIIFVMLIYLLSKLVIEKNANSISMVKILGYNDREINKLYNNATMIVVFVSMIVTIPIAYLLIREILFQIMFSSINGWLDMNVDFSIYIIMFLLGIISYMAVNIIQVRKIKKIPMEEALKNNE